MKEDVFPLGERGADADGNPRTVDFRLFIQILAFGECPDIEPVQQALSDAAAGGNGFEGTLYRDVNDSRGIGLAVAAENPDFFVTGLRELLLSPPFQTLQPKPEFTMLGRTYSIGYEKDLENILLRRPRQRLFNPAHPWAVWYPLRRSGAFARLAEEDQRDILMEHAELGISFSRTGFGNDIRLACHGLDKNDNDFVIGLVGPELFPLSAMVQAMRKTRQTSLYLERLGPFFIGKACWQSPQPGNPPAEVAAHGTP